MFLIIVCWHCLDGDNEASDAEDDTDAEGTPEIEDAGHSGDELVRNSDSESDTDDEQETETEDVAMEFVE